MNSPNRPSPGDVYGPMEAPVTAFRSISPQQAIAIVESSGDGPAAAPVAPDAAPCAACLAELRDPDDRRAVRLRLTGQGQRVAGQVAASRAAYFDRIVEGIPPAERDDVITAFQTVVKALDGKHHPAEDASGDERLQT